MLALSISNNSHFPLPRWRDLASWQCKYTASSLNTKVIKLQAISLIIVVLVSS